ncbi:MAG: hypothetical protein QOG01_100, partial [Pseudonocardiales bacterium]|nr:hypothetical protein [Pseudonocardiales bacterium]
MKISYSVTAAVSAAMVLGVLSGGAAADPRDTHVTLVGRAVLPVQTYADGPPSGTFLPPGVVNGINFPLP